jgi:hypothetical protein
MFEVLPQLILDLLKLAFVLIPAGTQGFPDILIKDFSGNLISIECKSSTGFCPMWNDNVPRQDTIYVFSSKKANATTAFLGSDVITQSTYNQFSDMEKEISNIIRQFKERLEHADKFNRGWIQKSRKQHFQQGGNSKTNYFDHCDRVKCEQNVLSFALMK